MILEEIEGNVKVVLNGKTLSLGSSFDDGEYSSLKVIGTGKAIFRTSPSTTAELRGEEAAVVPAPAPAPVPAPAPAPVVEAAPVAELVPTPVETTSTPAEEETSKK